MHDRTHIFYKKIYQMLHKFLQQQQKKKKNHYIKLSI